MQVGDLVTIGGRLFMDDKEIEWVGILLEEEGNTHWIVHWNDGKTESLPHSCLEVIG